MTFQTGARLLGLYGAVLVILLWASTSGAGDLLDCYLKAKQHDPQYLSVYHESRAQQTLPKQSWSQLLPQVQGSYSTINYDYTEGPASYKDYRGDKLNVSLRQTLFSATRFIDLNQNKLRAFSGELRLSDAKNNLMVRISEAYFKHLHAVDYLDVLLEEQKANGENLKMVGLLFKAGEATLVDLHDAEARKAEVDFRVIEGANQVEITRQELERFTGDKITSVASLSDRMAIKDPVPASMEDWIDTVKERNPAVRHYANIADIAKDELTKQKAQHLPTLDLVGFYNKTNSNDYVRTEPSTYYAGGVQLSMPLWTSGYTTYRIQEFREKHAQSVKEYEKILSDTVQNVRTSFLGVHSSISKVKSAEAYLNASQTALTSTRMGYQSGVRTIVDLLNATSNFYKAKGELLQVRINYVLQQLRLFYWNGSITEDFLGEINQYLIGRQ